MSQSCMLYVSGLDRGSVSYHPFLGGCFVAVLLCLCFCNVICRVCFIFMFVIPRTFGVSGGLCVVLVAFPGCLISYVCVASKKLLTYKKSFKGNINHLYILKRAFSENTNVTMRQNKILPQ